MMCYTLKCENGHRFDSWFKSAAAFETLQNAGHVSCAECGTAAVEKAIMAPRVSTNGKDDKALSLSDKKTQQEQALSALRKHVEENADYVGTKFADEARSMYLGASPERAIYGEANAEDARKLIEDGVPVAPLPFRPTRKAN